MPTAAPTPTPTAAPTVGPSATPTQMPTASPTTAPTAVPTTAPTFLLSSAANNGTSGGSVYVIWAAVATAVLVMIVGIVLWRASRQDKKIPEASAHVHANPIYERDDYIYVR